MFVGAAQADPVKDVSYDVLKAEALDIYVPDKARKAPVMVYVHGGAWTMGDKAHVGVKPKAFNDEGYVFVSVGYPLLPEHGVDVQAQSVADAIVWVEKNIDQYGGNPKKINVMGHSSGGHLVALAATDDQYLQKAGSSVSVIKKVVLLEAAGLDVPLRMRAILDDAKPVQGVLRNTFGLEPTKWQDFSPVHYAQNRKKQPRFLALTANSEVAEETAYNFVGKLGRKSKVVRFPKKTHRQITVEIGEDDDPIFEAIMKFVD